MPQSTFIELFIVHMDKTRSAEKQTSSSWWEAATTGNTRQYMHSCPSETWGVSNQAPLAGEALVRDVLGRGKHPGTDCQIFFFV